MLRASTDVIRAVGNSIQMSCRDTKQLKLNEQEIVEWIKCRNNPIYFIYHYVKFEIIGGVSSYKELNNFHPKLKRFVKAIYKYHKATLLASRQLGKSSINAGLIAWTSIFFPKNTAVILNFKKDAAISNLLKVKFINQELPPFLQLSLASKSDIKTYLDFSNGSNVKVFYP